ncbi:MAG: xanthine dehydrogenase family protein subunit M [Acidimicrobiia bacterium]|nr:xanthine dehydrogenase family protein subunit M [Acidimicrobiia bacterium]
MNRFQYARPETVGEAVALLEEHGDDARLLAGGTDLVIELRNRWVEPKVVIDLKRIPDLAPAIVERDGFLSISASTVMTDIAEDERVQRYFPALVESAVVVGSVQIRARATMAGNICNGSPAADTAPPLLVYDAVVVVAGSDGERRVPIDDFIVGPGKTALQRGELVTAIELPIPERPYGAAYTRLTRRRGTDLASITLCAGVDADGQARIAYGSVGPRAFLVEDESGILGDSTIPSEDKIDSLDQIFYRASPSLKSLRASPDYRLAMLRVLGARALETAIGRLTKELVS